MLIKYFEDLFKEKEVKYESTKAYDRIKYIARNTSKFLEEYFAYDIIKFTSKKEELYCNYGKWGTLFFGRAIKEFDTSFGRPAYFIQDTVCKIKFGPIDGKYDIAIEYPKLTSDNEGYSEEDIFNLIVEIEDRIKYNIEKEKTDIIEHKLNEDKFKERFEK